MKQSSGRPEGQLRGDVLSDCQAVLRAHLTLEAIKIKNGSQPGAMCLQGDF